MMHARLILVAMGLVAAIALGGCADQGSGRVAGDPRLKGYEPWTAPATDSMVELWYLTATPEEIDRYWLTPPPPRP